ncbi:MAG: hypothetical protein FWF15_04410 [Oscillospiraceae bacterium]|nr:hypothetical protein [Oscillospiraceae bacterium]
MKKVLPIFIALLFILAVISCSENESGPVAVVVNDFDVPEFSVIVNGVEITQITLAECPVYSVESISVNSSGTESTIIYVGFAIKDILKAAGLNETYVSLEATASDGYTVTLTGDVIYKNTTLLAMTKDGAPFAASPWLAPCSDKVTGNYLKGTVSILVSTTQNTPDIQNQNPTDAAAPSGELPEILDRTDKVEFEPYSFLVNGKTVTNDTLAGLKIYKITAVTVNKSGDQVEAGYTGYKLADVLNACGLNGYTKVKAIANDGYETELSGDLITSDYTLVAIEKDKELGEGGTVWLAPCSETSSGTYCKLVVEITAE